MKGILCFVIALGLSNVYGQKKIYIVNAVSFDNLIELGNKQILDVRTDKEFNEGHIKGALNIDFWNPEFLALVKSHFNKSEPLLIYCAGGGRSSMASQNLVKKGYKVIYDLEGGYEAYIE